MGKKSIPVTQGATKIWGYRASRDFVGKFQLLPELQLTEWSQHCIYSAIKFLVLVDVKVFCQALILQVDVIDHKSILTIFGVGVTEDRGRAWYTEKVNRPVSDSLFLQL